MHARILAPPLLAVLLVSLSMLARQAIAHNGGIIVQASDGKLVTGYDDESGGTQTIGVRAFSLLFPSSLANDVPSFLSLQNAPPGSEPLPVGGELFWDFLPMSVESGTGNLLYWDGLGTTAGDIEFNPVPLDDVALSIWTQNFTDHAEVRGAAEMVPGRRVGTVSDNSLALHAHRWFFMESDTTVPEGIYLVALQLRMDNFIATDPFYVVAATDGISASTLDGIALPWVAERVDSLVLDGDYDFDGDVDGDDYSAWRQQFGATGPFPQGRVYADGNRDGIVNAADYTVWRDQLDASSAVPLSLSHAVPEPASAALLGLLLAAYRRRSSRVRFRETRCRCAGESQSFATACEDGQRDSLEYFPVLAAVTGGRLEKTGVTGGPPTDDVTEAVVLQVVEERITTFTYNFSVEGVHTVYVVDDGVAVLVHNETIVYVGDDGCFGITDRPLAGRTGEHLRDPGPRITKLFRTPDRGTAQGVEQLLIEWNREMGFGPHQNNPISPRRTDYAAEKMRLDGEDFLRDQMPSVLDDLDLLDEEFCPR